MPLTTDICRTGSPNFFIRGPHKLLHKSTWAEHLTYWDCFGICYILPNQSFSSINFSILIKVYAGRIWPTDRSLEALV